MGNRAGYRECEALALFRAIYYNVTNMETIQEGSKKQHGIETIENPIRKEEFDLYLAWKSLPSAFRNPPRMKNGDQPTVREFASALGIEDEETLALMELKTQGDFAKKYGVDASTLTGWNKLIARRDLLADTRQWALGLTKNVLLAVYNSALKGNFLNAKLFFQVVNEWQEKVKVDHRYEGVTEFIVNVIPNGTNKHQNQVGSDGEASRSVAIPDGQGN